MGLMGLIGGKGERKIGNGERFVEKLPWATVKL
jgi:hypothetical protein